MSRQRLLFFAGLGAAAGLAVGLFHGGLAVHRSGDWAQGTLWLAWSRLDRSLVYGGLAGALAGTLLGLLPLPFLPWRWASRGSLAALALLAALAAWMPLENAVGSLRAGERPAVVIVSIDTLRADRLVDAPGERLMPRVRALVDEGTVFTQATSAAPWTLPSHASLFTSMLPFDHRAQWSRFPVRPRRLLLSELFRDAGYRTAAFTGGGYAGSDLGFGQGFEIYEDHDELKEGSSKAIFANALAWARRHRDMPFFLFVHTYEVHSPYYRSPEVNQPTGRLGPVFSNEECESVYRGDLVLTPEEQAYVTALYDSDVRSADRAVGGFLETLREEGILEDAILVVLSDHGEDLWDHVAIRSPGHGHSLYEEMVRVPLAVRAPGRVAAGKRLSTPVGLVDVAPTLLDLCELPPSQRHVGRSLAGSLREGAEPEARPILSESIEYGPDRFALREGPLKVVFAPYPDRFRHDFPLPVRPVEIFDLSVDPLERDPESGRQHAFLPKLDVLVDRARRVLDRARHEASDEVPLPEDVMEQLRSLGYVD